MVWSQMAVVYRSEDKPLGSRHYIRSGATTLTKRRINTSTSRAIPAQKTDHHAVYVCDFELAQQWRFSFWQARSWCIVHLSNLTLDQRETPKWSVLARTSATGNVRDNRDILLPAAESDLSQSSRRKRGATPRKKRETDSTQRVASDLWQEPQGRVRKESHTQSSFACSSSSHCWTR